MAIYHLEAKVISRGAGRSACAASAYMSCSRIFNDYDGVQHDYTRKQGLKWEKVFLPPMAPPEWQDREQLWNAVEAAEKAKDSRLAREFVIALPVELDKEAWVKLLSDFIQEQFVKEGMCADVAIHDTDGHNPHAHIMLTVRPLTEKGTWQQKTQKEYLCVRGNEEQGFTAEEFKTAQNEGWEKQYQYKVGKKKVWMTTAEAEAHGYERVSKYPKSTKFGRQNPISERWNSEDQLVTWRAAWADAVNRSLEQAGRAERIDHRSHTARGLDEQPTIHEGVAACAMEKQGINAERCAMNRQIKADNRILRNLKATIARLTEAVKQTVPTIADALETIRANMIVLRYAAIQFREWRYSEQRYQKQVKANYSDYQTVRNSIRDKLAKRKKLQKEYDALPIISMFKRRELAAQIAELTEEIEELRSEETSLIRGFGKKDAAGMKEVESEMAQSETRSGSYWESEQKYSRELDAERKKFMETKAQADDLDQADLIAARMDIRPVKEQDAIQTIQRAIGREIYPHERENTAHDVDVMLDEEFLEIRYRAEQRYAGRDKQHEKKTRSRDWER
ncbi:MAG: MobA/MobL family protein [Oscillospiraceae bacterium]|nr:MobA/MobL family protein [Oscillospiraceae bacterium]